MNKKEELIWKVVDNVISCCCVTKADGTKSITREDVIGKSREENIVMTRCLVMEQMVHAGFTIAKIAGHTLADMPKEKMLEAVHLLALDKLKDSDGMFDIRAYFHV